MVEKIFIPIITMLFLITPVLAQENLGVDSGITPGSAFYKMDLFFEEIRSNLIFNPEKKISYALEKSDERLAEIDFLITNKQKLQGKVLVCHQGSNALINIKSLKRHLEHGDTLGGCEQSPEPEQPKNETPPEEPTPQATCTDSDGGINYYEKGVVTKEYYYYKEGILTKGNEEYVEICNNEGTNNVWNGNFPPNTLHEGYCSNNDIAYEWKICSEDCINGACVDSQTIPPKNETILDIDMDDTIQALVEIAEGERTKLLLQIQKEILSLSIDKVEKLDEVQANFQKHINILTQVRSKAPIQAQKGLTNAIERSSKSKENIENVKSNINKNGGGKSEGKKLKEIVSNDIVNTLNGESGGAVSGSNGGTEGTSIDSTTSDGSEKKG